MDQVKFGLSITRELDGCYMAEIMGATADGREVLVTVPGYKDAESAAQRAIHLLALNIPNCGLVATTSAAP